MTTANHSNYLDGKRLNARSLTLVCGFGRSGTTWLAKILDSVPTVYFRSEPDKHTYSHLKFGAVPHCIDPEDSKWLDYYRQGISELLDRIDINLDSFPFFNKKFITVPYVVYWPIISGFQLAAHLISNRKIRPTTLPQSIVKKGAQVDLVWKSVNQSSNLEFLRKAFPGIRIIYLLRNPYSVLASMLSNAKMTLDGNDYRRILERQSAPFFKNNPVDLEAVRFWPEIQKRALLWRIDCESAITTGEKSQDFHLVIYKDLVADPLKATRRIFQWLRWNTPPETESFLLCSTGMKSPPLHHRLVGSGYFGVYRKPGGNIDGWKDKLGDREYEQITAVIKDSPLLKYWPEDLLIKSKGKKQFDHPTAIAS